jgi:hypothetical protein
LSLNLLKISSFIQWRTQQNLLVGGNQVTGGVPRINFQNLEIYLSNMNKHYSNSKIWVRPWLHPIDPSSPLLST